MKIGRNDPCFCGSGKKYKKCCARKHEQNTLGFEAAIRMKGGVMFDKQANAFRVIVHTWDNSDCVGDPEEWQSEQTFQSEDSAMFFYKQNIRPKLESYMQKISDKEDMTLLSQRLED